MDVLGLSSEKSMEQVLLSIVQMYEHLGRNNHPGFRTLYISSKTRFIALT